MEQDRPGTTLAEPDQMNDLLAAAQAATNQSSVEPSRGRVESGVDEVNRGANPHHRSSSRRGSTHGGSHPSHASNYRPSHPAPNEYSRYGGYSRSQAYDSSHHRHPTPYDRPASHHQPSQYRSRHHHLPPSGWISRPRTIEDLIKTDELAASDQFYRLDDAPKEDETSMAVCEEAYKNYLQRHRKAILERFFWTHYKATWFKEFYDPDGTEWIQSKKCLEQRLLCFKEAIDRGELVDLLLEDGDDLKFEAAATAEGPTRNIDDKFFIKPFPSSIKVPDRIKPALIQPTLGLPTILASNLPPNLSRGKMEELLQQAVLLSANTNSNDANNGNDNNAAEEKDTMDKPQLVSFEFGPPQVDKGFYRTGWAVFSKNTDLASLQRVLDEKSFENTRLFFSPQPKPIFRQLKYSSLAFTHSERILIDLEHVIRLVELFDRRAELSEEQICPLHEIEVSEVRQKLDIHIAYLRRVHLFCYYCGFIGSSEHELEQHCGAVHLRSIDHAKDENKESWKKETSWFDFRLEDVFSFLEFSTTTVESPLSTNLTTIVTSASAGAVPKPPIPTTGVVTSNPINTVTPTNSNSTVPFSSEDAAIERYVIKVEEGRYRCHSCNKLFRGAEFVVKHIRLKHEELVAEALNDQMLLKKFLTFPIPAIFPFQSIRSPGALGISPEEERTMSIAGNGQSSRSISRGYRRRSSYDHGVHHHHHPRGIRGGDRQYNGRPLHNGGGNPNEGAPLPPLPKRPLHKYVDLDAPATGDVEINYD